MDYEQMWETLIKCLEAQKREIEGYIAHDKSQKESMKQFYQGRLVQCNGTVSMMNLLGQTQEKEEELSEEE